MSESLSVSQSTTIQRKAMRKGTRSCAQCRRRKIRCVFRPNNTSICVGCFSRGIRCVSQEEADPMASSPDPRMNLRERVARIEQQLASMQYDRETTPRDTPPPSNISDQIKDASLSTIQSDTESSGASHSNPTPSSSHESLPMLSLFDNAIIALEERNIFNDSIQREFSGEYCKPAGIESNPHFQKSRIKRAKVCGALTSQVPSHAAMNVILEAGGIIWDVLRNMYPCIFAEDVKMTLQRYVIMAFNQDNPAVIGCALSWMALSMQCLPLDFESDNLGLPLPVDDLIENYISNVDRLVVSDDELSVSLEGIENILLQCQFYGNIGRPRKAWTTARRGISYAVMLGLHRASKPASNPISAQTTRQESVWHHLVDCDSYLSLLLGLPSFMITTLSDLERHKTSKGTGISSAQYRNQLSIIVGTISHRNPPSPGSSISATLNLDHELEHLASLMPTEWWHLSVLSSGSFIDILEFHERLSTQFFHNQAKIYLHLPFMLQSLVNCRYEHSRTRCLTAARNMIQIYVKMQELAGPKTNFCSIIDFQAFTGAVILILGLLGKRPPAEPDDVRQGTKDWALIDETIQALRRVRTQHKNLTAVQCLKALETLVIIGHGHFPVGDRNQRCRIFIPYLGIISIAPGNNYSAASTTTFYPPQETTDCPDEATPSTAAHSQNFTQNPLIDIFDAPLLASFVQNRHPVPHFMQDTLAMDIDQDWSWMSNENYQGF